MPKPRPSSVTAVVRTRSKTAIQPELVPVELIGRKIYAIRGQKVMLDADLAELYEVETKALNRAVKRNVARFPIDFMYQLTGSEAANLRSNLAPQVCAMVAVAMRHTPSPSTAWPCFLSVLNSERAVQMNILIVRAFVKLRDVLATNKELALKIERLAHNQKDHGPHSVSGGSNRDAATEKSCGS